MIDNLDILKQRAEQAALLQNAQAEYEAALAQQKEVKRKEQLVNQLSTLNQDFEDESTRFSSSLASLESELRETFERINSLENKILKLRQNRDKVINLAAATVRIETELGQHSQLAQTLRYNGRVDQDFLNSVTQAKLQTRFTLSNPLALSIAGWSISELASSLLGSAFWRNVGMILYTPKQTYRQVEPETVSTEVKAETREMPVSEFLKSWNGSPR